MPKETRTRFSPAYLMPAKARLECARKAAVESVRKILARYGEDTAGALAHISRTGADDWREYRKARVVVRGRGQWQARDKASRPDWREFYVDSLDCLAWRQTGRADEVSSREGSRRVDHSGWFTFPDGDTGETLSGYVLQLPARDGRPRYVPAIAHSAYDGATVRPLDIYDSALDAAGAADQWAEREAEQEREYQTAWAAGTQWADLGQEVKADRRDLLDILAERRQVKGVEAPALCAAITSRVRSILARIAENREARSLLSAGEWKYFYFYPGEKRLREAFNEGAGAAVLPV